MKKIIFLIPVFNDWESLKKLIYEINENIKDYNNIDFECLIVNDSSTITQPELNKPKNIKSLKILNMKENRGHARCNAFGIRYVFQKKEFDNLILMDGDGEDRPVEIKSLVNENSIVVLNKSDIESSTIYNFKDSILVSVKENKNIDQLVRKIKDKLSLKFILSNNTLVTRERHRVKLNECLKEIKIWKKNTENA
jgi:hypothetical protein